MTKKQAFGYILTAVIVALFADVFFGRYIGAKITTMPLLNRLHLVSPQAPIVINNQQIIHTSDSTDLIQAANSAKSKLSTVATVDNTGTVTTVGSAVNVGSDGVFVTGLPTFSTQGAKYFVVLSDGTTAAISTTTIDSYTGLIFFKAQRSGGVSPADLGKSSDLLPGEKVLFLTNSLQSFASRFAASFVERTQGDVDGLVFSSDKPSLGFGVQAVVFPISGEAVVNLQGQIVGIWNGTALISSDVLRQEIGQYFSGTIAKPQFNFTYTILTKTESQLAGLPQGALVKTSAQTKGAQGLESGDIITSVENNAVSESNPLEIILQKYKTGDTVSFAVWRNKQQINLSIKAQ